MTRLFIIKNTFSGFLEIMGRHKAFNGNTVLHQAETCTIAEMLLEFPLRTKGQKGA